MSDTTARDRVWLVIIDSLHDHKPMQTKDVVARADVSDQTARAVLRLAENEELVRRESEQAQTFYPNIGSLGEVADKEYQRLIIDLLAEKSDD